MTPWWNLVFLWEQNLLYLAANFLKMKEDEEDRGDEEEAASVFSSSWLPQKKSKVAKEKAKASKKRSHQEYDVEGDEDLVEDLVLSSDDDGDDQPDIDSASEDEEHGSGYPKRTQLNKKQDKEHGLNRPKKQQLNKKQKLRDSFKQNIGKQTSVKNPSKRKQNKRNARYGKKKKAKV